LKHKFIFIGLLFLIIFSITFFDNGRNTTLEGKISEIIKNDSSTSINIKSLTSFPWNKAYLFAPYTPQEKINKQLGVKFKDASKIYKRDDIYLLVFLNADSVIHYSEIKRQHCDFYIKDDNQITPSNSTIKIKRYNQ